MIPRCLTIAGSDSGGGAGIQADLKAFAAAGCHGMSAIVALTAQNTTGVTAVHEVPPDFVRAQLEAVFDDLGVDAAKTGMLFSAPLIETVVDFLEEHPVPLVVDPVLVASSGARLLQEDAVETLVERLFPLATVITPNLPEAQALAGEGTPYELAERLNGLGARAVIVTGGHGDEPVDHLFDGEEHVEIPVERHRIRATHGAGCTHSATLAALLARGESLEAAARGAARVYVVMNETANATLALGALPVMAHAPQEVEEMASVAGALVLNIGTLSEPWIYGMLLAGAAANRARVPVVLDPVGAGATRYRTETARRLLDELEIAVVRGNAAEVATLAGQEAEIRGVESVGAAAGPELAEAAARALGCVAAVTGPVDHISDGERGCAIANGHELLGTVTGTGCMATAMTGCFLAVRPEAPLKAAAEALVAFGVAAEDAAAGARGPGSFHVALYDALAALDPDTLDARAKVE